MILLLGLSSRGFAAPTQPLKSAPITLAWQSAGDPSVAGYGVYYGPTNQVAMQHVNAGTNLSVTLFDLDANTTYRFYAISYDTFGSESVPSNELLITPPVLSRLKIARQAAGNFSLSLRAAPGSVCQIEYAASPASAVWQTLGLATANANGDVAVVDPTLGQLPSRFYRVARLLNPPPFTQMTLTKQPGGFMGLSLNGSPGTTWAIEYTDSLSDPHWIPLTLVTANAVGDASVTDYFFAQQPSRFYRAAQVVNPPPFTRLQVTRQSNGSMKLNLNGSPGTTWNVQFASAPTSAAWTTLASVTANITGEASVTDAPPAGVTSRFYRASLQ